MNRILIIIIAINLAACTGSKKIVEAPVEYEERMLDTMMVVAPKAPVEDFSFELDPYNPSHTRTLDLLHTKLTLSFDWDKQHVLGLAELTLKPYFYPTDELILDAVGFDIHGIFLAPTNNPLTYDYDGSQLAIKLNKVYTATEKIDLIIDYTAKPNETPAGGSAAITSEKGLFFINPLGDEEGKPQQIWTQGETENNSRWFPTIDKPNERSTQEMILTVQDRFKTLSNGLLISSTQNDNGTRTDYWKMDQPHAPYLFMLAIGEFAKVDDQWEDIPLSYYVDPEYEAHAKKIFDNTPEMLAFFSEYTGVKYPWSKYAQVITKDYVSGAMENTTAVIFGDFIQRTSRELIDNDNDYIVAHEMFHHWFGDYVTCESWANLTLNEGFANYSEYLWEEYKRGSDALEYKRLNELRGYLSAAQNSGTHDLIDFDYADKEDMFDAHSYNKGGLVMHMLRNYVGDAAFRAALKYYLTENAYSDVEAHELRLAFEEITGEDLNWFFNQWFFDKGHPELEIVHGYTDGTYSLQVFQKQDAEYNAPIFILPVAVDIYTENGVKREKIIIDQRTQTFTFEVDKKPLLVNFDADNIILGVKKEELSNEEFIYQYYNAPNYADRYHALAALRGEPDAKTMYMNALEDPHFALRRLALMEINIQNDKSMVQKVKDMAMNDPHSAVRAYAIKELSELEDKGLVSFAEQILQKEQAYPPYAAALSLLYSQNQDKGLKIAETLMDEKNYDIVAEISSMFAASKDPKYLPFFEKKIESIGGFDSYPVFGSYLNFLQTLKIEELADNLGFLINMGKNDSSGFKRFMATNTLNSLKNYATDYLEEVKGNAEKTKMVNDLIYKISSAIREIKKLETNPQIKMRYNSF